MSILGESNRWHLALHDGYSVVVEAIYRVWPACQEKIALNPDFLLAPESLSAREAREDPITRTLIVLLRRDRGIRDSPLMVESQRELLPDDSEIQASPVGYLDIAVLFLSGIDKLCLALECKRINVLRRNGRRVSLAGKYVKNGMMRFVQGQYSPELSLGGMIGYVMNGKLDEAAMAIKAQIRSNAGELLCDAESIDDRNHPHQFSTNHKRPTVAIQLRHMLLSVTT
jgi:hypothetical protein